ncbi:hypothetical protein JTB14_029835 [Gonioctena quinquepunctata]|nr:hypothetical protein JTB14_029835 [Gonioctena quinquepunctata]
MDTIQEKTWLQICAVVIAGFSSLTNGIFFSWPSPFILKISQDKENYNISEEEASRFVLATVATIFISCPIFSKLSDIYGRKRILLLTAFVDVAVWILKATAKNVYVFYFARVLVGISDSIMFASLPPYIAEVASPRVRATWGSFTQLFFVLGELLVTVVGSYFNVQETSYILLPIPIIFFILFSFMPESPYYYIMKGKYKEAQESLQKLKRKKDASSDLLALKSDVEKMMSENGTWKDLFMIHSHRKSLSIAIFLMASPMLGGTSIFIVYTQYIFEKSGGNFSKETSSIIYIGLTFMLCIGGCFLADRLGRKKAFIGSLVPCGLMLFIESIYFYIHQYRPDIDISSYRWIPLAGMVLYKICSCYGIELVPALMLREIFSIRMRVKSITVWTYASGIVAFITNYLFNVLNSGLGLFAPFLFFASCNMISAVVSYFISPETKGKTLGEIQEILKGNKSRSVMEDRLDNEKLIVSKVNV